MKHTISFHGISVNSIAHFSSQPPFKQLHHSEEAIRSEPQPPFSILNPDVQLISLNSTSRSETTKNKPLYNISIQASETNLKTNKPNKHHHNQNSMFST